MLYINRSTWELFHIRGNQVLECGLVCCSVQGFIADGTTCNYHLIEHENVTCKGHWGYCMVGSSLYLCRSLVSWFYSPKFVLCWSAEEVNWKLLFIICHAVRNASTVYKQLHHSLCSYSLLIVNLSGSPSRCDSREKCYTLHWKLLMRYYSALAEGPVIPVVMHCF